MDKLISHHIYWLHLAADWFSLVASNLFWYVNRDVCLVLSLILPYLKKKTANAMLNMYYGNFFSVEQHPKIDKMCWTRYLWKLFKRCGPYSKQPLHIRVDILSITHQLLPKKLRYFSFSNDSKRLRVFHEFSCPATHLIANWFSMVSLLLWTNSQNESDSALLVCSELIGWNPHTRMLLLVTFFHVHKIYAQR